MRFPEAIAIMRRNGVLNVGLLHFFDFVGDPRWYWMGTGDIVTAEGRTWKGLGDIVSIEGGGQVAGVVANNLTLTLSAPSDSLTDDLVQKGINSATQVTGRRYTMAVQFCNEDWQPVDEYRIIYVGVMDRMSFVRRADFRQIILNVESPFVRRRAPRLELFTDRDQKSKFPNDRAFELISTLENKAVTWPNW